MGISIVPNNKRGRDNTPPPSTLNENGEPYRWRMFFDNNSQVADADTRADLINVFIPGYVNATSFKEQFEMLIDYATSLELQFRVNVLSQATKAELEDLEDWEREYLYSPYIETLTWEDPEAEVPQVWKSALPVFLVNTFYEPYTDIPRPLSKDGDYDETSNVFWFNANGEEDFLDSLERTGQIVYGFPSSEGRRVQRREK